MAVRVIPVSETRAKIADLIKEVTLTGEPCFITQRSQATAVLLGIDQYNSLLERIAALECHAPTVPSRSVPTGGHQLAELLSRYARAAGKALA